MTPDERLLWVKAKAGRRLVQTIEPAPCGLSVTTAYFQGEEKVRQDIAIVVEQQAMQGDAGRAG